MPRAAILRAPGELLAVEEIILDEMAPDQVRVRVAASGVCRSDLLMQNGTRPHPTPVVLGHEGAGVVLESGADVKHVGPGDHVALANSPACRRCWYCSTGQPYLCEEQVEDTLTMPFARSLDGERLISAMGTAAFATEVLVLGRGAIQIDKTIPFDVAALVSCAVVTGVGATLYTAPVEEGSSVAIFGCGGVGLSALLGATYCGAEILIAVDPVDTRRNLAEALGATHSFDPSTTNVADAVRAATGSRGADYSYEAVGSPTSIRAAYEATRRGGTIVVIGASALDAQVSFPAFRLYDDAKVLVGCQSGSAEPVTAFPKLLSLWKQGDLPFDRLITSHMVLDEINDALAALASGSGLRTVIVNDTQ